MRSVLLILLTLILSVPGIAYGQKGKKITITGKVVDTSNKPVAGATIFIDKKKTDVVTDQNGSYSIKVKPDASDILVFSLLSGATEEKINGRTEIDFVMTNKSPKSLGLPGAPENKLPDKAGKDKNLPEKSKVLNIKDSAVPAYQDIYDMIRGRVPGVEVSGKSIKIRGSNSLNVSTEPLFVVDGVIVKEIDDISPETVKSIEVLKGPDASIYGTRGSNGVIVITRRTGKD
jgi:TonB-dependent SusC/RagA subfamily outer membrane receptor